jgi:hypothetical protein
VALKSLNIAVMWLTRFETVMKCLTTLLLNMTWRSLEFVSFTCVSGKCDRAEFYECVSQMLCTRMSCDIVCVTGSCSMSLLNMKSMHLDIVCYAF